MAWCLSIVELCVLDVAVVYTAVVGGQTLVVGG